jgi:hypothetical protein
VTDIADTYAEMREEHYAGECIFGSYHCRCSSDCLLAAACRHAQPSQPSPLLYP